jgi:hypothetical protein
MKSDMRPVSNNRQETDNLGCKEVGRDISQPLKAPLKIVPHLEGPFMVPPAVPCLEVPTALSSAPGLSNRGRLCAYTMLPPRITQPVIRGAHVCLNTRRPTLTGAVLDIREGDYHIGALWELLLKSTGKALGTCQPPT